LEENQTSYLKQNEKFCIERQPNCYERRDLLGIPKMPWGLHGRVTWTPTNRLLWVTLAWCPRDEAKFNLLCLF